MQSISGACRKALPARDEGDGKRCEQLIQEVVKSNETGRGSVKDTKAKIEDFPTPPPPKLINTIVQKRATPRYNQIHTIFWL